MTFSRMARQTTAPYVLRVECMDDGGTPVTPTAVSVTVYDGADVAVASGLVTTLSQGWATCQVPAASMATLDMYRVEWASDAGEWSDTVEVCGGRYFTIAELRASDPAFADADRFPSAFLERVRCAVEDTIEAADAAGVAFVRRGARVVFPRPDVPGTILLAPHVEVAAVYAVAVDGVVWSPEMVGAVRVDDAALIRDAGWWGAASEIAVHYEHGRRYPPEPVRVAALRLAREFAVESGIPGRATATSIGDQMFRLTIAGRDGATGIPEVDATVARFGRVRFGQALA